MVEKCDTASPPGGQEGSQKARKPAATQAAKAAKKHSQRKRQGKNLIFKMHLFKILIELYNEIDEF